MRKHVDAALAAIAIAALAVFPILALAASATIAWYMLP